MTAIREVNPHLGHKDEFIPKHLRLVHHICQKHKRLARMIGVEYDDMYAVGCIGLIKAFDNFAPTENRKAKFSTYAAHYIDGYIRNYAFDSSGLIHIPRKTFKVMMKMVMHGLLDEDPEVVASQLRCTVGTAELARLAATYSTVTMEAPIPSKRDDNLTLADTFTHEEDLTSVEMIEFLGSLSTKEKEIIGRLLMGQSQLAIGKEMEHCTQTIRLITRGIQEKLLAYVG